MPVTPALTAAKLLTDDLNFREPDAAKPSQIEHQLAAILAQSDAINVGRQHGVQPFGFPTVSGLCFKLIRTRRQGIAARVFAILHEADIARRLLPQIDAIHR